MGGRGQAVEDGERELEELGAPPSLSGHQRGLEGARLVRARCCCSAPGRGNPRRRPLEAAGGREEQSPGGSTACRVPVTGGFGLVVACALGATRPDHRGLSAGGAWRAGTPTEPKRNPGTWEASVAGPRPPGQRATALEGGFRPPGHVACIEQSAPGRNTSSVYLWAGAGSRNPVRSGWRWAAGALQAGLHVLLRGAILWAQASGPSLLTVWCGTCPVRAQGDGL
ncbi:hypothetical protein NDU88_001220 [Pleurodeles waltl]|uniref:Uncharacterized protein n=1 Tax=Pleurodeles waltl TaxID=8319 RepID=A0AAV7NDL2_PLEWA|nr:hypothetical protein NDU88_001220 [Pleurodeles waltl]